MATFSVDSDAVLTATGAIRATADRLQGETAAMLGQLAVMDGQSQCAADPDDHGWLFIAQACAAACGACA